MIRILLLSLLSSCTNFTKELEHAIGVQADDNAILTVCVSLNAHGIIGHATANVKRVEVPTGLDISDWTFEQIEALHECPE